MQPVSRLPGWQKDHFSDTHRNRPQHSVEINSLMNGTRRLMFATEIKNKVLIRLIILESSIMMREFCPTGLCPERAYV